MEWAAGPLLDGSRGSLNLRIVLVLVSDEMVWPPGLIQIGPNHCYRCLLKF
jgi:hypothetical protein